MIDHVYIDGNVYCTANGARQIADAKGWKGIGGGRMNIETVMRKLALQDGGAILWRADDSVTTWTKASGKVRQRTDEAGSDAALWAISRFRKAADRG